MLRAIDALKGVMIYAQQSARRRGEAVKGIAVPVIPSGVEESPRNCHDLATMSRLRSTWDSTGLETFL